MNKKETRVTIVGVVLALVLLAGMSGQPVRGEGAQVQDQPPDGGALEAAPSQTLTGNAFTYQGYLTDGGSPANGLYDLAFSLYADAAGTQWVVDADAVDNVNVVDGLFTAAVDVTDAVYGDVYFYLNGDARYLRIGVRPGASAGAYTYLSPLQPLTPVPYALALPGLNTVQNGTSANVIGGYSWNYVDPNVVGATIGGGGHSGGRNEIYGDYATVGGGRSNDARQGEDTVGGGASNTADGGGATVGGGSSNVAGGLYATVPGGYDNTATGTYSFAAGRQARAIYSGCFVWGDNSTTNDVSCYGSNRTVFRNAGGIFIYTNAALTTGVYLSASDSSWNSYSAREAKENLRTVDAGTLLARLAAIPISTWNYKAQDPAIRHVGPMAQDFNTLIDDLGGEGEEYIDALDADGVALAAIQGLYQLSQEQAARIEALEAEKAARQAEMDDLEARVSALEQGAGAARPPKTGQAAVWLVLPGLVLAAGAWAQQRKSGGGR